MGIKTPMYAPYNGRGRALAVNFDRADKWNKRTLRPLSANIDPRQYTKIRAVTANHSIAPQPEYFEFASLLGIYSTTDRLGGALVDRIKVQDATPMDEIAGVTIINSLANEIGVGLLTVEFDGSNARMTWEGSGAGKPVIRSILGSGEVELTHIRGTEAGVLLVSVDKFKLVSGKYRVYVDNIKNSIHSGITSTEVTDGFTRYVGITIRNDNPLITYGTVTLKLASPYNLSNIEISLGADPAGVNAVGQIIPDSSTSPIGVNFLREAELGEMEPNSYISAWIKLHSDAYKSLEAKPDIVRLLVEAKL